MTAEELLITRLATLAEAIAALRQTQVLFCAPEKQTHAPCLGCNRRRASLTVCVLIHCRGDVRPR
jgi:hypothetical protein